jgi:hypothetical protein
LRAWARGTALVVAAAAAGGSAVLALEFARASPAREVVTPRLVAPPLAPAPAPAFTVPTPRALTARPVSSLWAPVRRNVLARLTPGVGAAVLDLLSTTTPEGTSNIVQVLGRRTDATRRLWIRVRLPVLPNGTTAWVPRSALGGYGMVHTHLVVDLEGLTATLYRAGHVIFQAPVGVGTPAAPTPRGEFYVRDELTAYRSPFYGPIAFGTSARSAALTDWPAGGYIGIHGTDAPQLIPGRVSHGCIRLRNDDILRLARLMPVGTPLTIR